uniref:T-cell receptor alpha chain constant domain-containing protein n=1 Tax=Neovison vison TaxID=452646 RepID=A0A8C7BWJ2_NEOVI
MLWTYSLLHLAIFCAEVSLDIVLEPDAKTLTVQVGEPATLRCSVTGGDLKNYQVNITDPDPAVYQLRSPKSSNISVCLFTDFDSETNEEQAPEPTMTRLKSTVLDMWSMNSKSNGALAWSASTDFKCNETFHEEFYSNFSCNATLIEKNFETDMNLNFHNLFMIGLRVILLKVAGFNLLMTLQLWSR